MKKISLLCLLNFITLFAGKPLPADTPENIEAVLNFVTALTCPEEQQESWKERSLGRIINFNCNVFFSYKRIKYYGSPLFAATVTGDCRSVEKILKKGALVDFPNPDGVTPLMQAAFQQNVPLFTKLKHAGADMNAIDEDGFSVLNHAENGGPYNPVLNFFLQTLEPEQPHLPAANEHPHPTTPLTQQHVVFFENPAYEGIQGEAFGDLMDNVVRYFAPSH